MFSRRVYQKDTGKYSGASCSLAIDFQYFAVTNANVKTTCVVKN